MIFGIANSILQARTKSCVSLVMIFCQTQSCKGAPFARRRVSPKTSEDGSEFSPPDLTTDTDKFIVLCLSCLVRDYVHQVYNQRYTTFAITDNSVCLCFLVLCVPHFLVKCTKRCDLTPWQQATSSSPPQQQCSNATRITSSKIWVDERCLFYMMCDFIVRMYFLWVLCVVDWRLLLNDT